jgi:hypothetical protein
VKQAKSKFLATLQPGFPLLQVLRGAFKLYKYSCHQPLHLLSSTISLVPPSFHMYNRSTLITHRYNRLSIYTTTMRLRVPSYCPADCCTLENFAARSSTVTAKTAARHRRHLDLAIYDLENHHSRLIDHPETYPRLPHLPPDRGRVSAWSKTTLSMSSSTSEVHECRQIISDLRGCACSRSGESRTLSHSNPTLVDPNA